MERVSVKKDSKCQSALVSESEKLIAFLKQATTSISHKDTLTFLNEMQKDLNALNQEVLNSALLIACSSGNQFLVRTLLLFNVDVDCKDAKGNTPLMLCAMNSFCDISRMLIQRGADVNSTNDHGDSALILSITDSGSTELVRLLLEQSNISIFLENGDSHTSLTKAVEVLDFEIIQMILRKANSENSLRNNKELYNQTINLAMNVAKRLGVLNIFNYLEKEISGNRSSLLSAVFESDLESVNFILNFGLSKDLKQHNQYESLIIKVLGCFEERKTVVNNNDIEIVRKLLDTDKLITLESRLDINILKMAVHIGNQEILDLLCHYVNKCTIFSSNSPHKMFYAGIKAACETNSCEMLKILLQHRNNYTMSDYQRTELTKYVLVNGSAELSAMFLKCENDIDVKESLLISIKNNQVNNLHFIVEKHRHEANLLFHDNQSYIMHKASEIGNREILIKLIQIGANVNILFEDKTPLMCCRKAEIASLLIDNGADVNLKVGVSQRSGILNLYLDEYFHDIDETVERHSYTDNVTKSDAIYTIEEMKRNLLSLFIAKGANIEDKDSEGRTVLMLVSRLKSYENTLTFLLEYGADPDNCDKLGKTALHFSVSEARQKKVEILLRFLADVNKKCHLGMTCLHLAVKMENLEIVKILVNHRADVNVEDNLGNTPLWLVFWEKCADCDSVKFLLVGSSVESIDHQNKAGNKPLMIAEKTTRIDIVKLLCVAGASVNKRRRSDSKNVVEFLIENYVMYFSLVTRDLIVCINYLLDNGGSAAKIKTKTVFQLISDGQFSLIQKMIFAGLSPSECPVEQTGYYTRDVLMVHTISPFCYALLKGKVELAKYFNTILFLTTLDISDRERVKAIRIHLSQDRYQRCLEILDELTSQPLSLQQMCLITVSSHVGARPERESDIKQLPLASVLKNQLLFKPDTIPNVHLSDDSAMPIDVLNNLGPYFLPYDRYDSSEDI